MSNTERGVALSIDPAQLLEALGVPGISVADIVDIVVEIPTVRVVLSGEVPAPTETVDAPLSFHFDPEGVAPVFDGITVESGLTGPCALRILCRLKIHSSGQRRRR